MVEWVSQSFALYILPDSGPYSFLIMFPDTPQDTETQSQGLALGIIDFRF